MKNNILRILLYIFSAAVFFVIIRLIFDFNGLYGQDSYDYLRFSRAISEYFQTGTDPGSFFWPVNYPFIGAIVSLLIPSNILSLQLISYLSFLISGLLLVKIINLLYGQHKYESPLFVVITFLFSPYVLRASLVIMSDVVTMVFILACLLSVLKYRKYGRSGFFLLAILFFCLAGFTRYHAFVILFIPMILVTFELIKKRNFSIILPTVVLLCILLVPTFWLKVTDFFDFTGHQWFNDWSPLNWFKSSFNTTDGYSDYTLPNILYGFIYFSHPGFLFFGLILILFFRIEDIKISASKLIIGIIIFNALFIAGIPYQNLRFHISIYPFLIILLFPAFLRLMAIFSHRKTIKRITIVVLLLIQSVFFVYLFEKFHGYNKLEKQIATSVKSFAGNPIYTFSIDQALDAYDSKKSIENIWKNKYSEFDKNGLFLFNEGKFKDQWEGKNPMVNWENVNKFNTLKVIKTYPEGWILYEIE